jgi:cell division protein FtsQ
MRRVTPITKRSTTGSGKRVPVRRKPWPRSRRLMAIWGGAALGVATVVGGIAWVATSDWTARQAAAVNQAFVDSAAGLGFTVERVLADGRQETTSGDVLAALNVRIGEPILGVDLVAARERLLALPWVESATIERELPDTLHVRIEESTPLALWQNQGKVLLVSRSGKIIEDRRVARFPGLLLVVGPDAPTKAAQLMDMLATQPQLRQRVTAAVRVGGRRWNLRLDNGIDVKLPEENSQAAWTELARLEQAYGLLARDLTVIDLRLPDKLVVRVAPAAVEQDKAEGNDT